MFVCGVTKCMKGRGVFKSSAAHLMQRRAIVKRVVALKKKRCSGGNIHLVDVCWYVKRPVALFSVSRLGR